MSRTNIWTGLVVLIIGLAWTLLSLQMPLMNGKAPGSGLVPLIIGTVLAVLGGILALEKEQKDEKAPEWPRGEKLLRILVTLGSLAAYALLMDVLGFLLCSFLFLVGMIRFWGSYSWPRVLVLAVFLAGASYFIFEIWLDLPLPTGLLLGREG